MRTSTLTRFLLVCFAAAFVLQSPRAQATGTLATLHSFTIKTDPLDGPVPGLARGTDGNFYGTTQYGGIITGSPSGAGDGGIFKITPAGTYTHLHYFSGVDSSGHNADGAEPWGGLVQGANGNFYGTTQIGGSGGRGTVFMITPAGALTTLHNFSGADGDLPLCTLCLASDGNFYGTTYGGGSHSNGTIFKMTPGGTLTVLYSFSSADGINPWTGLAQGTDGNFYGTCAYGGAHGSGAVFSITPTGSFTTLYSFSAAGTEGANPVAPLVQASDGNFYGTTQYGGSAGNGSVFCIAPDGTFTLLYTFSAFGSNYTNADGANPAAGLIEGTDGNLYGVAQYGGSNGSGTIFSIPLGGGALTVAYTFAVTYSTSTAGGVNADGAYGSGNLFQAADGTFFGTCSGGGSSGDGTVFHLYPSGGPIPILGSISPSSVNAGSPGFTMILKGANFVTQSVVKFNGAPITTTFVSSTQLQVFVPFTAIESPTKYTITVFNPGASGGTSNSKAFTVLLTTLQVTSASLAHNGDGTYTAFVTIKNVGHNTASSVVISSSTLGAAATATPLPYAVGNIAAGAFVNSTLLYPGSAGGSGSVVTLKVSGKFTGGTFSGSLKVTLP